MHLLKSIRIDGYLGRKNPIYLDLSKHPAFIIGRNGTGKTSLINFINACLDVDKLTLRKVKFECVELKFKAVGDRRVPSIQIEKEHHEEYGVLIIYRLRNSSKGEEKPFKIETGLRIVGHRSNAKRVRGGLLPMQVRDLRRSLNQIYSMSWLSLHRHQGQSVDIGGQKEYQNNFDFEEDMFLSGVDRKLSDSLSSLSRYFTRLDRKFADKTLEFQRDWFVSFLADEKKLSDIVNAKYDMDAEQSALKAIFESFKMSKEKYENRLSKHIKLAKQSDGDSGASAIKVTDFLIKYDVYRLHQLVEKWQSLQREKETLYKPREEFVDATTCMLYKKRVEVDSSNEVSVHSDDSTPRQINTEDLSSGEKQLLIFFAETLLQERRPHIFLADEPELSLHLQWQEDLVPSILKMNPNAQIIFATHSPDIVGGYGENVIDMESLLP